MGTRVDENIERMRNALRSGETALTAAVRADAEIDAMNVSLTERCNLLLGRGTAGVSDLRFIVSVLGIISELERVGDQALRVVRLMSEQPLLARSEMMWDILLIAADEAVELFRTSLRAWSVQDLGLATQMATQRRGFDLYLGRLSIELQRLGGPDLERTGMGIVVAGSAVERIADHSAIIGSQLRSLLTGGPAHLASAVRHEAP